MNRKIHTLLFGFALCLLHINLQAQSIGTITPVLIGSCGWFSSNGNFQLSMTVGEVMVPTTNNGNFILTQGFQQPSPNTLLSLSATTVFSNVTCLNANDGIGEVTPLGGAAPYQYQWSSNPNDTLPRADSLAPGIYYVTVTDAGGLQYVDSIQIAESPGLCGVHFYNGLTPNGDGANEYWHVDYLELFTPNTVQIYNRWGVLVWKGENYDNQSVRFDGRDQNGAELADGTYFYLVTAGGQSAKGWIELTR